jgi:hypothetical protein
MPAGYSGTPLVQKLGIKPGHRILFVQPPANFAEALGPLPDDAEEVAPSVKNLNVILLFVDALANLKKRFSPLSARLVSNGALWVCWPKKASGVPTDLTEDVVRKHGLTVGLVDIKVCAVDEIWSGLKFVIPLAKRK